jgi:hypothetical protein
MEQQLMTTLTKAEIGRAVTAIRELADLIERLEKATWPAAGDSDIIRKADLDLAPQIATRAAQNAAALAALADAEKRIEKLEAVKDYEAQHMPRKTSFAL